MIPQPESDLSLNPIVVGSDVISILKEKNGSLIVEDLLDYFISNDDRRTLLLFLDTLTYLFSLNIIYESNYKIILNNGSS